MRKFLAVILAVLTLVTIVLPVFAAEATAAADKTTADDAKNLGLIVTEYISDTKSPDVGAIGDVSSATYNAFQFIEIYNSSDVDVDLYKVAIAATSNDKDANGNKYWDDLHVFQKKMQLRAGSIYNGVSFKDGQENLKANKAENPNSAVLGAGKTAIIWFWNDSTTTIAAKMTTSPGGDLPNPGIEPESPTWQAGSLPSEPPGKPSVSGHGIMVPAPLGLVRNQLGERVQCTGKHIVNSKD